MKRRNFLQTAAATALSCSAPAKLWATALGQAAAANTQDYHGFPLQSFVVEGCPALVVAPHRPLDGRPWLWRTMFWDAFPAVDLALLEAGFHVAFMDVGNTFGAPEPMRHFDAFHATVLRDFQLAPKPALEGLSRGGLYAYRWASTNAEKVACLYGDNPVCDMKSWPGGKGHGRGNAAEWQSAIQAYHFTSERQMLRFRGNPIDILAPIARAHVPVLHVCGDADLDVPMDENTDIVRRRYMALGGDFALIVKQGCAHHPHGLQDPKPVVDFILAHAATGEAASLAAQRAPRPGSVLVLPQGQW